MSAEQTQQNRDIAEQQARQSALPEMFTESLQDSENFLMLTSMVKKPNNYKRI